ncbi:unnamed protein product [Didymodactylos carnosus]|uniref:TLDc domain-containing protein n=1 Tax=Didymodactylos carnosus TaxID=1234261 RepID=A0A814Y969_9BILA|nr:unnamed protein product [Didymodactylos carnosus]CAF3989555.1 unnamed protein product [Didymodactylos carnosus]
MVSVLVDSRLLVDQCDELNRLVLSIKQNIDGALGQYTNEISEWLELKKDLLASTSIKDLVSLNVGGKIFRTSIETLKKEKDTFFTDLLSREWQLETDNHGRICIDRNGELFAELLDYLRTGHVIVPDERLCRRLLHEAQFYHFNTLSKLLSQIVCKAEHFFVGSTLLSDSQKEKLNEFYGINDQYWKLIYKGSKDGFDVSVFHGCCDNKGPTMTVIQSIDGYLFGGFTSVSWASALGSHKNDSKAFLFSLTSPKSIGETKFVCKDPLGTNAIFHSFSCGPTFGTGHDLIISNNSNTNRDNYCNFPHTYLDHLGHGTTTFTGLKHFQTLEIEVFKLA